MLKVRNCIKWKKRKKKKLKKPKLKKKKTETVNNKNSGHFRKISTDHKAQKESYASRSVDILFLLYFVFCSQNVSCGIGLLVCCICTRNLHENMCVCVCVCVCMRAYVCRGCCNINERFKTDTGEWVVGSRLWCCKIV